MLTSFDVMERNAVFPRFTVKLQQNICPAFLEPVIVVVYANLFHVCIYVRKKVINLRLRVLATVEALLKNESMAGAALGTICLIKYAGMPT